MRQPDFPPMSRAGMRRLRWDECDVIIVSGDAYVDHPSFGSAVICRVLLDAGYRVGIICQPDWRQPASFTALGRPRLFLGVTAGNVDSMLANRSPGRAARRQDDYAPGGRAGLRPDRATTVYCNRLRESFKDVPLVIGGIEASLRRLAHYDYWDDAVRGSILADTRADLLAYGMAERQVVEVARRLERGEGLDGIPGTAVMRREVPADALSLPALEAVWGDKAQFNQAFALWSREADCPRGRVVAQRHGDRFVVQYPVPAPLAQDELDRIYDLPYARAPHPDYREPVPALATVQFSITSHRGCLGSCSFCSLRAHQGRIIQWRSEPSIVREAEKIARAPGFKGHITDVGGPTANMYAASCARMRAGAACRERECTWPERCPSLQLDYVRELAVLRRVAGVPGVKKVSVGTGIRYDLIDGRAGMDYLEQVCAHHVSGQLRVAPEHVASSVLNVMRKAGHRAYGEFRERFRQVNERLGRKQYLIPYFISGHPGATLDDAVELAEYLVREERFFIRQVQQFTPLPMTAAGATYHTGVDPLTGETLHVARDQKEQKLQRALLQLQVESNFRLALAELTRAGRADLAGRVRRLKPLLEQSWVQKRKGAAAGRRIKEPGTESRVTCHRR